MVEGVAQEKERQCAHHHKRTECTQFSIKTVNFCIKWLRSLNNNGKIPFSIFLLMLKCSVYHSKPSCKHHLKCTSQ